MKYLFLFIIALFIGGCTSRIYTINIIYQDGTKESIRIEAYSCPNLDDGCLYLGTHDQYDHAIRCGIRSFEYTEEKAKIE